QLDALWKLFLRAKRDVVASENSLRPGELDQRLDDDIAKRLEAGAHELDDEPAIVAIADERRTSVALAVDEPKRVRALTQPRPAAGGGAESGAPPRGVGVRAVASADHAERDLRRRTPQRDADRLSSMIRDANRASRRRGPSDDVAPIDPWVALLPATS